jgi:hypothetical protein
LSDTDYREAQSHKRIRKKQVNDGSEKEPALNFRDKFHISAYCTVIDALEARMKRRGELYEKASSRFHFLNDMDLSEKKYTQGSQKLVYSYPLT